MANRNGLISSKDVSATGAINSNFFLRKGQAIVAPSLVSPVTVLSEDGTQTGSITENNTGSMIIASGVGDLTLYPGTGNAYILSSDSNSSVELSMANTGPFTIAPTGNTVVVGNNTGAGGAVLQINGTSGVGRVYDTVYNPIPAITTADLYASPEIPVATNALINGGTLEQGLYMLQATVTLGTEADFGTHINCYLEDLPPSPPSTYLPASSILIAPGALAGPVAPDNEIDASFSSTIFSIPAGLTHMNYFVEVEGNWNLGAGGSLQLKVVKLA